MKKEKSTEYPDGARIDFKTQSHLVKRGFSDKIIRWTGIINGEPLCDEGGTIRFIPAWCKREGREEATIMVSVNNVISIGERL